MSQDDAAREQFKAVIEARREDLKKWSSQPTDIRLSEGEALDLLDLPSGHRPRIYALWRSPEDGRESIIALKSRLGYEQYASGLLAI